jgi:cell division protein FtsB
MNFSRGPLFVIHAAFGTLLVLALLFQLRAREHDVARFRQETTREVQETRRMQQEIAELEHQRDGLVKKDPYMLELMVRDKLRYSRPGENFPPPTVDNPRRDGIR